jgi:hypothetical protein
MPDLREFKNSPIKQGVDEVVAYTINASPWTACPLSTSAALKNFTTLTDSASNLIGSASVSGVTLTTPQVASLIAGCVYRLEMKWQDNSATVNTFEAWGRIEAET